MLKIMKKPIIAAAFLFTVPFLASAATISDSIKSFITFIDQYLVPLIFAVALLVFLFGVFQYFILGGGDAEKRKEGRQYIMYGIIGFVIMISVWGLVRLVSSAFGLDQQIRPALPCFNGNNCNDNVNTGQPNRNIFPGDERPQTI
jgi:hypothetical protein